jgi:hypothetical protein
LPGEWCELAAELAEAAGQPALAADLHLESGRRALNPRRIGQRRGGPRAGQIPGR